MTRIGPVGLGIAAMACLVTQAPAQAQRPPRDASTRLHAARLREVLDLDRRGAISDYQAIAVERGSAERWVAVARLEELQRLGVAAPQPVPLADAPLAIRQALARLTPLATTELSQQATRLPAEPLREGSAVDAPLLDLHVASAEAQRWVRSQSGPSFSQRAATRPQVPDESRVLANFASDIVRRELEGRTQTAASLRERDFRTWRPPTTTGTPTEILARVRANLDAWIKESAGNAPQVDLLGRLKEELDLRQSTNPAEALQLVLRLPQYTERLVAEPPKPEAGRQEQGR